MPVDERLLERKVRGIRQNPKLASIIDKMVVNTLDPYTKGQINIPDQGILRSISDVTTSNILDSKAIFQILPDVELAIQILISTITAPKDMITSKTIFKIVPGSLNVEAANALMGVLSRWWTNTYKINERYEEWLGDILAHTGSVALLVLPESSIDAMINGTKTISKESIAGTYNVKGWLPTKGFLGSNNVTAKTSVSQEGFFEIPNAQVGTTHKVNAKDLEISLEDYHGVKLKEEVDKTAKIKLDDTLFVTDNYEAIKAPLLSKAISDAKTTNIIKTKLSVGLESAKMPKVSELTSSDANKMNEGFFAKRNFKFVPGVVVPKLGMSDNIGHPLMIKIPSEAVIPVHVPSNPREHIGYFILLDGYGNPVANSQRTDTYSDLSKNLATRRELRLNNDVTSSMNGFGSYSYADTNGRVEIDRMARSYASIVEADLLARLRNGIYGNNVDISQPEEVYRIMLSRHLANQKTTLLYVPCDLMTYMAFDYNDYGIGTSLLDKTKVISSLRAVCIFANTMASIKNATGKKVLNINLDPEDPNPVQTVNELLHHYINSNAAAFPLGATSAKDLTDYLQKAGVSLMVQGNSRYPSTSMTVDDKQSSIATVDTTLTDDLKKTQMMGFSLSPETLDATQNVEFATSIVTSNLLLAKRTFIWQRIFCTFIRKFIVTYTENSQILVDMLKMSLENIKVKLPLELAEVYKQYLDEKGKVKNETADGYKEFIVKYFLDNLIIELPQPDTVSLTTKVEALNSYTAALDAIIDSYISSDTFNEFTSAEDLATNVDTYKACIRSYFIRLWAMENDFLPELEVLGEVDNKGKPTFDLVEVEGKHIANVNNMLADFTIFLAKDKQSREDKITAAMPEAPEEDDTGVTDSNDDGGIDDDSSASDDDSSTTDDDTEGTSADDLDATSDDLDDDSSTTEDDSKTNVENDNSTDGSAKDPGLDDLDLPE